MLVIVLIGFVATGLVVWQVSGLPGSISWRARRSWQREEAWRRRAGTNDLVDLVRGILRYEQWQRFPSARTLSTGTHWTDVTLRDALRTLLAEVVAEDRSEGRRGRDSSYFEFHDSGLAGVLEIVEERTKS